MAHVSIRNVVKRYGSVQVIHGLDLEVEHNEFVVLVGPSGCGKSTMLRMIAGLEDITSGEIRIGDRVVNNVEPKYRNIAMVFQNYALYPHMTVARNISFGLRAAKLPKAEAEKKVLEAAQVLGLEELLHRRPAELSGGQRQRVAMGRAIVRNPQVFLFDEPLSNLDAKLRNTMRTEIKKLHQKVQTTVVYVTHDQIEAMTLADRIVIMRDGVIQQVGTPLEVFREPANLFVAGFIGSPEMNLVSGVIRHRDGGALVELEGGTVVPVPPKDGIALDDGRPVVAGLRPEHVVAGEAVITLPEAWRIEAAVNVVEPLGSESLVMLDIGGREIVGKAADGGLPAPGDRTTVGVNLAHLHLFDPDSEQAIY